MDKLNVLFEQINLEEDIRKCFSDAKLKKVIVDSKNDSWTFIIKTPEILSMETYKHLYDKIKNNFNNIKKIYLCIESKNVDYNLMREYYSYTFDYLGSKSSMMKIFKDREVNILDKKLVLEVHNKAEETKIKGYLDKINLAYKNYGFKDNLIAAAINLDKGNSVKEEITKDLEEDLINLKKEESKLNPIVMGEKIKGKVSNIRDVISEENNIIIDAYVFAVDIFESNKKNFKIITLKVTDYTDSLYVKIFTRDDNEFGLYKKNLNRGSWLSIRGYTKNDSYSKDLVLNARDINIINGPESIKDKSAEKRVELHVHTLMSQMDSVVSVKDIIARAKKWGHSAIAITDHNSLQGFPDAFKASKDIKVIYGVELNLIDDEIDIVKRSNKENLEDQTYVVFDFETTGMSAANGDSIVEVGAVKMLNGEIIDEFSRLIDPGHKLASKITEITGITDKDLRGKRDEETEIKEFIEWAGDLPMVAHNAPFDESFLRSCYQKYSLGEFDNPLIDTLVLSRNLEPGWSRHGLGVLVKKYNVELTNHHRATDDARATAYVFDKMIKKMNDRNIDTMIKINKLVDKDELHKTTAFPYHVNIIVQNEVGLKNLFKIVSFANTKYFYKSARILKSIIDENREGLLIGSSCAEGEIFTLAGALNKEELINKMKFYDYIEIQPLEVYDYLLQRSRFNSKGELISHIKNIVNAADELGKIVVATGDVHHLDREDKIFREVIINQKVPGGGLHPLNRRDITEIPSQHFRTTDEMLKDFEFLGDKAKEIVIDNTIKISEMVDKVKVIKEGLFAPKMEGSAEETTNMVNNRAKELYGDPLPMEVKNRIKEELDSIIGHNFDVIYLIAERLVKKSNEDGYLVGSRGSIGSSFAATMMGITEVNPLPAHYLCPKCKTSIFEIDGEPLGTKYSSGYDLPNNKCKCGEMMKKEGQDMPFATFLGFKGDKIPDIDLNFSGDYQSKAHDYTKVLFGERNVFRAGTMTTVASKTAYGFSMGYSEDKGIRMRPAEIERLAIGCTGVKRTTGQHPGGIIVIPDYKDILDFTPYQYPADDVKNTWYTTHFDYHSIEENVLKLDMLGHDDPTILRMLQDLSGIEITTIPFDDKDVLSIFSSPTVLGVTSEEIMCDKGTLGIPEFGTNFVVGMLNDTNPKTFSELVKISGLSHGTDVWLNNAQELVRDGTCKFKDVIGCRDDIMVYLMNKGLEPIDAFKIMEYVRKGILHRTGDIEPWNKFAEIMRAGGIDEWYIESCRRIKYMFPKAHATAYVMMAFRVAYFKVHHPSYYYSAYFSVRCHDFDIEAMIGGYDKIKERMNEIVFKGYEATNKESSILDVLKLALEASVRGFKFGNIDLEKSDSTKFLIDDDGNTLIPPFRSLDGLGNIAAETIIRERNIRPFISVEDVQKRGKVSSTIIEKMRNMNVFEGMPESSQLSLF